MISWTAHHQSKHLLSLKRLKTCLCITWLINFVSMLTSVSSEYSAVFCQVHLSHSVACVQRAKTMVYGIKYIEELHMETWHSALAISWCAAVGLGGGDSRSDVSQALSKDTDLTVCTNPPTPPHPRPPRLTVFLIYVYHERLMFFKDLYLWAAKLKWVKVKVRFTVIKKVFESIQSHFDINQ